MSDEAGYTRTALKYLGGVLWVFVPGQPCKSEITSLVWLFFEQPLIYLRNFHTLIFSRWTWIARLNWPKKDFLSFPTENPWSGFNFSAATLDSWRHHRNIRLVLSVVSKTKSKSDLSLPSRIPNHDRTTPAQTTDTSEKENVPSKSATTSTCAVGDDTDKASHSAVNRRSSRLAKSSKGKRKGGPELHLTYLDDEEMYGLPFARRVVETKEDIPKHPLDRAYFVRFLTFHFVHAVFHIRNALPKEMETHETDENATIVSVTRRLLLYCLCKVWSKRWQIVQNNMHIVRILCLFHICWNISPLECVLWRK